MYDTHTVRVAVATRRDELTAVLDHAVPRLAARAETLALFLIVSAFWALVLYEALTVLQ